MNLFKSYISKYKDGEQLRDFIYVKDICSVLLFLLQNHSVSGLFNVGTGKAETFYSLASHIFEALNLPVNISFIDMPETIKNKYQYFTEAAIDKLCAAGYNKPFTTLHDGVYDYVANYLNKDFAVL